MTNEALRTLRALAFDISEDLKALRRRAKDHNTSGVKQSLEYQALEKTIRVWDMIKNSKDSEIKKAAGRNYLNRNNYCAYRLPNDLERLAKVLEDCKEFEFATYCIEKEKEDLFYDLGDELAKGGKTLEHLINKAKKLTSDNYSFNEWEAKRKETKTRKEPAKKVYEVKERYQRKENEISVKSFCCGVMAAVRDFMIAKGIEDYKGATCELGQARRQAVRSLMCYSKTQEASKVENFKKLVSNGLYSGQFENWKDLRDQIRGMEEEFTK